MVKVIGKCLENCDMKPKAGITQVKYKRLPGRFIGTFYDQIYKNFFLVEKYSNL